MKRLLNGSAVPAIRALGFSGSFPHFRRRRVDVLDFISFQFHKYGGSFAVEIGQWPAQESLPFQGDLMALEKLNTWMLPLPARARLQALGRSELTAWFSFKPSFFGLGKPRYEQARDQLMNRLPQVAAWFEGQRPQSHVREFIESGDND